MISVRYFRHQWKVRIQAALPAYLNPPNLVFFIGTLSQTLTLRAAFASSGYLLSQIPGPGRSSDDDLLTPPFMGAIRVFGLSIAARLSLPANSGPASDDALFGTIGRRLQSMRVWSSRGFFLLGMTTSVRHNWRL